jgi:acyl-coenzyme A synthetase/AMP-(fatty) acid ligase
MPTVIRRLAEYLVENDRQLPNIRLLLYVGEHLPID